MSGNKPPKQMAGEGRQPARFDLPGPGGARDAGGVWIVIPVYNAAATLPRCLDSLLAQTCPHWDACLVDDCSTDASWDVMQAYAARDRRFHCMACVRNSGPAAARNLALQAACGRYVAFLDSDDWWSSRFLEEMTGTAERCRADIVQCAWTLEWPDGASLPEANTYPELRVFDRADFAQPLGEMMRGISMNHVARKLVRRHLLEGLAFPTGLATAEDLAMSFRLLLRAQRIVFLPQPLYHYYRRAASLTGSALDFRAKWRANRAVSRLMREDIRGTAFDTPRLRFLVWARPYRLVLQKALRLLQDKRHQRAQRAKEAAS